MVGKLPEFTEVYKERSPLYHAEQLKRPLGFYQGTEDHVVPPEQSEAMYKTAEKNKAVTFYNPYPGEAHGFKKAATIQRCLADEIYFYSKIFGFELADETAEPPDIKNLPGES
jgi:dipeptidyl aminopeptidase/acylaminoacyl peptidase